MMPETTCTALADAAPVDRIQRWSTILLLAGSAAASNVDCTKFSR